MTLPEPATVVGYALALWAAYESRKARGTAVAVESKTQAQEQGLEKRLRGGVETFSRLDSRDEQQAEQIGVNTAGIAELRADVAHLKGQVEVLTKMLLSRGDTP